MDYVIEAEELADNGKYYESNELLNKAIEKDPQFIGAYINKGANFADLGQHKKAIQVYQKALFLDTKNTMLLFNLGNNYQKIENYTTALDYYNKAFKTKGGDKFYMDWNKEFDFVDVGQHFDIKGEEIYFQRGITYLELDSVNQAFSDLNNSLRRNYEVAASLYYIGILYLKTYQDDLGCESLRKSASLGYEHARITLKEYCDQTNP